MNNAVLVLGESGSGKSTSIRSLPHEETFIIKVISKPLPFRGSERLYPTVNFTELTGNQYISEDYQKVMACIKHVNNKRPDIKHLIVDDCNYLMTSEFMDKAFSKGFDKFTEMAKNMWDMLRIMTYLRNDLYTFMMFHTDHDAHGKAKTKTIGKLLDEKICIEGLTTIVLHAIITDQGHKFLTQNSSQYLAKSPDGMFSDRLIDNDLLKVKNAIHEYYNQETI
jgi:hypothetical protein